MENLNKTPKFSVMIKQTSRGKWYVGYIRIDAETINEFENLVEELSKKVQEKVDQLNKKQDNMPETVNSYDDKNSLMMKLKELRLEFARKEGVSPFIILHDSVLKQLAEERPKTKEEFIRIVGEKKYQKYGEAFLQVISEFEKCGDSIERF
jgi:superfamily II DNA helicase RecQ